jgi:phage shock protein PspC (stress-responsive transcriptional regulator)
MENNRPSGVTIVAVLAIVSGIILIVGAVFTIYLVPSIIISRISSEMSELSIQTS